MIGTKAEMYDMLYGGEFGNTVPMWFSAWRWLESQSENNYPYWGIRTLTPGGPCLLNCPAYETYGVARKYELNGHSVNISPMIDRITTVTMWANLWDSPSGLVLECIENPPKRGSWRELMPIQAKTYTGTAAKMRLERHLNPNSLDDLRILIDQYPNAVYEFSAMASCFGTVPGRNAVIWEVRHY